MKEIIEGNKEKIKLAKLKILLLSKYAAHNSINSCLVTWMQSVRY
jgi:hypothetical protein